MCCDGEPSDLKSWHQILRWSMFGVNILLFCCAAVLMGFAVYMINSKWELLSHDDNIIPVIMFITFAIIMLVTTIGALGACNLSRGFLIGFIFITIICLCIEITLIVYVSVSDMDTESFLSNRWNDLSNNDKEWVEDTFECCGLYDGDTCVDSDDSNDSSTDSGTDSTTGTSTSSATGTDTTSNDNEGCLTKLQDWVESIETVLLIIGVCLLLFQVGGAIVSLLLLKAINNAEPVRDDSYVEYGYYDHNI